jgi:hypothetical protein
MRHGYDFPARPEHLEDRHELDSLTNRVIVFQETEQYPSHSPLRLDYLLHITDYLDSVMAKWYAAVVSVGYEDIRAFSCAQAVYRGWSALSVLSYQLAQSIRMPTKSALHRNIGP